MKTFLKPNKKKIVITILLIIIILVISMVSFFISLELWQNFGVYMLAPIFYLDIILERLFHATMQDFEYCLFPFCNQVAFLLTSIITIAVLYLVACFVERIKYFKKN